MEHKMRVLRDRVYSFIFKFVKNPQLADDLTQDIMLKVWRRQDQLLHGDDMNFYVLKMAKNAVFDHFKHLSREKAYQEEVWRRMQTDSNFTEDQLFGEEMELRLSQLLQELPARQQQVFQLHHDQDLSLQEISEKLQIAPNTAKNHLFRALKVIRTHFKPELFSMVICCF
ncbi:MAG TPA: sigma-70 family RNA polymerase sigma factor [Lunatimonas sp.]|nr:sigma-70 family RNA polymerase sigma factor [Lunatimonas sp.]